MSENFDLESVDFLTVGTIGAPGQRIFHLQARSEKKLYTVILEKEQAVALAENILSMLDEIKKQFDRDTPIVDIQSLDLHLNEPILPLFRAASLGLGYESSKDRIVVILNELLPEDDPSEPQVLRILASREQARILSEQTLSVAAGGRPICGNCGRHIEPDGHYCPKSNGHKRF